MSQHAVCDVCGGNTKQTTTSMQLWHGKQLIIVSDVPSETCQQCGQSRVSKEISRQIDAFLKNYEQYQPQRYLQVPEFSASQIVNLD